MGNEMSYLSVCRSQLPASKATCGWILVFYIPISECLGRCYGGKTRCHYGFLRFPNSECLENFLWAKTEFHYGFQLFFFFFTTINNRPINHNYKSINREKSIDRPTNTSGSFLEVTMQVESLKSIFFWQFCRAHRREHFEVILWVDPMCAFATKKARKTNQTPQPQ